MEKTIISEEVLRIQKTAGIITEGQFREALDSLNEDGLELKKIARDLYSWFKKQGIPVKIEAATASGQMAKAASGKTMGDWMTPDEMEIAKTKGSARIFYYDDPKTKQTIIEIVFFGPVQGIQKVEKLFLQAYPNLEQYDRKLNQMSGSYNANLSFRVREKTTKKGGLAGNTPTKPAAQNALEEGLPMGKSKFAQEMANTLNMMVGKIQRPDLAGKARALAGQIISLIDQDQD